MDKVFLGIPARQTERIIAVTRIQDSARETENQEVFISLPVILRQKDITAPHGIVLKSGAECAKTTLLTPKIDAELEIPEEDIHTLPKAMDGVYRHFRGAYCTDQKVILILNPQKLLEAII